MSLAPGTRLGPFEILALLGAGGMGEVYTARDTRLDRTVAIKVLPETLAVDQDVRLRFDREARAVASLSHPHICALYDVGNQDGVHFLVMEYLEGETLAERLARAQGSGLKAQSGLPLEQALRYAIEIADALDKAHRAGIVHRDLKPGNIMLTKSGAKLLDFGLARTGAAVVAGTSLSMSPTTPPYLTAQGTILGTFQYMAPEQVEGHEVDSRTDIFAFGAVLYEMVTGRKAFEGKTQASLIGAILKDTPPSFSAPHLNQTVALEWALTKCLAKDPDVRWQSARDLHDELQWVEHNRAQARAAATQEVGGTARSPVVWTGAALLVAAVLGGAAMWATRPSPSELSEMRLEIAIPGDAEFVLSPDGRSLVFSAGDRLWLRPLGSATASPLVGTARGTNSGFVPFWSPDSQSLGFFADGKLKRLDLKDGLVQTLADSPGGTNVGGTWNDDNVILIGANPGPIQRLSAAGGSLDVVTRLADNQVAHRYPQFLSDGTHFLFFVTGAADVRGVYVGSLASMDARRLIAADAAGGFLPPHFALFVRQGALLAHRFDLRRLEPIGEPLGITTSVGGLGNSATTQASAVSTSGTGLLAYRSAFTPAKVPTWFDRSGRSVGTVGSPDENLRGIGRISPDGQYATLSRTVDGNGDIWLVELERNVLRRLTIDPANDGGVAWSPDASRVVFDSNRTGTYDMYLKSAIGDAPERLLLDMADAQNRNIEDWSPDGRFVLYTQISAKTSRDLWVTPVAEPRKPMVVAQSVFAENKPRFSGDGRWIAYQSNETGRNEVYVQRFPEGGEKSRVSTEGGTNPAWRRDGREIFFASPDNRLMAVAVTLPTQGASVRPGVPVSLFTLPTDSGYAVTPDGQRFLVLVTSSETDAPPITMVVNWKPAGP